MNGWLLKIRSLHTYVVHRMFYFERYCVIVCNTKNLKSPVKSCCDQISEYCPASRLYHEILLMTIKDLHSAIFDVNHQTNQRYKSSSIFDDNQRLYNKDVYTRLHFPTVLPAAVISTSCIKDCSQPRFFKGSQKPAKNSLYSTIFDDKRQFYKDVLYSNSILKRLLYYIPDRWQARVPAVQPADI